ncbi:ladderlectin-like [Thunnus albacares]|uniref:ladderlectin-like n=1 Tax=Thunnus albacares TaxID=8236 RepID=UPI001CF638AD|nr:ladderlectin-like [Thunnus albacares]XP_044198200.1 ladderlectin-like [Thunnus albacares]
MKLLTVSVLICSMMALAGAAEAEKDKETEAIIQEEEHRIVKRSTSCPYHWTKYNGRCFLFVPRTLTWAQAERNCQSKGAHLASIHGTREYNQIKRIISDRTHRSPKTWIGGSDSQEEGVWLWSDGTRFAYSYWCRGEPNNNWNQDCIQMNYGGNKCWDDVQCNSRRSSVCAKKI